MSTESKQTLMTTVAQQRVSTAIEADQSSRQSHMSGVLTDSCASKLDHGVPSIGYGIEAGGFVLTSTVECVHRP